MDQRFKLIAIEFVEGDPKAQPRPRAFSRGGVARVYDPGTAEGWKSKIAAKFRTHIGRATNQAVCVQISLLFRRPKSHFRTGRNAGLLRTAAPVHHTRKPDTDNAAKAVLDALAVGSGIGVIGDDANVVLLIVEKAWANPGESPGALIQIHTEFPD